MPDLGSGEISARRPLTDAELAYLSMIARRARVWIPLLGGVPLIVGSLYGLVTIVRNGFDLPSVLLALPISILFGYFGFGSVVWACRSRHTQRNHRYAAGAHAGIFNVVGRPSRLTIGGVVVNLPDGWDRYFGLFDYVEVELYPAPGDPLRRDIPRHVISAFRGRLSIDREVRSGARRTDGYAWVAPGGAVPPAAAGRVAPGPSPE